MRLALQLPRRWESCSLRCAYLASGWLTGLNGKGESLGSLAQLPGLPARL
jgi:hypothetical protein